MKDLTEKELEIAFWIWYTSYDQKQADKDILPFLNKNIKPSLGWLRQARTGQFLSTETVAEKMEVTKSAYAKLEANEEKGTISLQTLAKAAEAMDCELVYAIRPKKRLQFSKLIWDMILPTALKHPWMSHCDPRRKGHALAHVAKETMLNTKFRRQKNWSQRKKLNNLAN